MAAALLHEVSARVVTVSPCSFQPDIASHEVVECNDLASGRSDLQVHLLVEVIRLQVNDRTHQIDDALLRHLAGEGDESRVSACVQWLPSLRSCPAFSFDQFSFNQSSSNQSMVVSSPCSAGCHHFHKSRPSSCRPSAFVHAPECLIALSCASRSRLSSSSLTFESTHEARDLS